MLRILALTCGIGGLLLAADDPVRQKVQVSSTQRLDLASGGTVRVKNSTGELTIEGWDQPGVEITTVKSTRDEYTAAEHDAAVHDLDRIKITAESRNGEVVITTDIAKRHPRFPSFVLGSDSNLDVSYRIKVPRDAHLVIHHQIGEIHIDDVAGDIHATSREGTIALRLPPGSQYDLDTRSKVGSVTSDFPGTAKRRLLVGHAFVHAAQAAHKLYLRTGFGDIIILEARKPQAPAPLNP